MIKFTLKRYSEQPENKQPGYLTRLKENPGETLRGSGHQFVDWVANNPKDATAWALGDLIIPGKLAGMAMKKWKGGKGKMAAGALAAYAISPVGLTTLAINRKNKKLKAKQEKLHALGEPVEEKKNGSYAKAGLTGLGFGTAIMGAKNLDSIMMPEAGGVKKYKDRLEKITDQKLKSSSKLSGLVKTGKSKAEISRLSNSIAANDASLAKIEKLGKRATRLGALKKVGIGAGVGLAAGLAGKKFLGKKDQKEYSFFESDKLKRVVRSAFCGAVNSMNNELNGSSRGDKESPVFGTIYIDRFVEKSRYIDKECKFQIAPNGEIEVFWDSSSIGWGIREKFEPFDETLTWKKLSAQGKAQDGKFLPATLITDAGKKFDGRVLIEVKR